MRYKLPKMLGEVECVFHSLGHEDGFWIVELVDTAPGMRIEIEKTALTEVPPPLPAEPEPGAYLIGKTAAVRVANEKLFNPNVRWVVSAPVPRTGWFTWAETWKMLGGPDVTITPLVPAPSVEPVTLPWARRFEDGSPVEVLRSTASNRAAYVSGWGHLTAADALEMAAALIAAAAGGEAK